MSSKNNIFLAIVFEKLFYNLQLLFQPRIRKTATGSFQ